jgi:hypothetical protein
MTMRRSYWVSAILMVGLLAFAGCGGSDKAGDRGMPQAIDLAKFQQAFPAPSATQQDSIGKVSEGVRYGLYPEALAALDKLAADPALTEGQKKAVTDLVQGIKETTAKAAAPAAK